MTEHLTYFFDMRENEKIGQGELRFNSKSTDPFFQQKPFVGYTETTELYRKQGLGIRRLCMMNTYSSQFYNLVLYSSDAMEKSLSKFAWEKLVTQSLASKLTLEGKIRYCFKDLD